MTDQAQELPPSARKKRSPSYPGIDLGLALERAQVLWDQEHHYAAAVQTVLSHWGYGAKSGGGFAALAALKSFGLAIDEGSGENRTVRLSRVAQDILTTDNEAVRTNLIQKCALTPKAHAELWTTYKDKLPSDQNMELFLIRERDFTPSGAKELISEWKRTMAFAGLTADTDMVSGDGDPDSQQTEVKLTPPAVIEPVQDQDAKPTNQQNQQPVKREQRTVQVTYSPTDWALIQGTFPMSEADWDAMIAVLQAMKVGLVQKKEEAVE